MSNVFSDDWDDFPLGEDPGLPANEPPASDFATELNIAFGNLGKALSNYFLEIFEAMRPTAEMMADIMAEASRVRAEERRKREIEEILLDIDPNNQPRTEVLFYDNFREPDRFTAIGFDGSRSSNGVVIGQRLDPLITALYYDQPIIPHHTNEGVTMSDDNTPAPETFTAAEAEELLEGAAEAFSSPITWVPKDTDTAAYRIPLADIDLEKLNSAGVLDNRVWILPAEEMPEESPIHEEVLEASDPSTDGLDEELPDMPGPDDPLTDPAVVAGLNRIYDAAMSQADEDAPKPDELVPVYPQETEEQRAYLVAMHEAAYAKGRQEQREDDEAEFEERLVALGRRSEESIKALRNEYEARMKAYGEGKYGEGLAANTPVTAEGKLLFDAARTVNGARQDQYGKAEDSFQIIADYWSTHLESRQKEVVASDPEASGQVFVTLEPQDVAYMMVLFKLAREANAPKRDNRLDAAGYLALAERCLAANEPEDEILDTTPFDRYPGGDSNG